jgi:hypothetical protein
LTKFCNKSSFNGIGLDRLYTIWRNFGQITTAGLLQKVDQV